MPDVEVGLGAVVGDEDLAVLERVHRARVDVEVRVELLHDDAEPAGRQQIAEAGGRQALAERGDDASGDEDVLRAFVSCDESDRARVLIDHHGLPSYVTRAFTEQPPACYDRVSARRPRASDRRWRARAARARGRDRSRCRAAPRAAGPSRRPARRLRAAARCEAVTSPEASFTTRRWFVAKAATCARCVTTITCARSASVARRRPISIAAEPPTPASTSSNTNVGTSLDAAMTTSMASITRESSPPDAPLPSGRGSLPGCGRSSSDTTSAPRSHRARRAVAHLDDQLGTGHGERRELVAHARREVVAGFAAQRRQRPASPLGSASASQLDLARRDARRGRRRRRVRRGAPLPSSSELDHVVEGGPVLADECRPRSARRSCTDLEFARDVGVEDAEVARQAGRGLRTTCTLTSASSRRSAASVGSCCATRSIWRRASSTSDSDVAGAVDRVGRQDLVGEAGREPEVFGVAQSLGGGVELVVFAGHGGQPLDLVDRGPQGLGLGSSGVAVAGDRRRVRARPPARPRRHRGSSAAASASGGPAVRVDGRTLRRGGLQADLLGLPVHHDEVLGEVAEHADRRRCARRRPRDCAPRSRRCG